MSSRSDTQRRDETMSFFKLTFLRALVLLVVPWTRTSCTSQSTTSPSRGSVLLAVSPPEQATRREVETSFVELPERGKIFFQCSRRRAVKAGQWKEEDDELKTCQKQDETMSLTRDSSEGTCGGSYQLNEGAQVTVRLPSVSPVCDMLFTAVGNATLVWHCPMLTLASHGKEYLFFSTGDTLGRVHYTSDGFSRTEGLTQLYLLYTRTQKQLLKDSNVVCVVKTGDKTGVEGEKQQGGRDLLFDAQGTQPSNCSSKCGMAPTLSGVTRVVGGANATEGEYPWMAAVYVQKNGSYSTDFTCGGSILTNKVILTAAHCLPYRRNLRLGPNVQSHHHHRRRSPHPRHRHDYQHSSSPRVEARVGVLKAIKSEQPAIPVERYILHPDYDLLSGKSDVALLILAKELEWTEGVGPICLSPPRNYTGEMAILTGWGHTKQLIYEQKILKNLSGADILQEVTVQLLPLSRCANYVKYVEAPVLDTHICAAFPGKGACKGDSGGPLIVLDRGIWYQLGVASRSAGCADPAFPFLLINVSSYIPWILSHISGSC